MTRETVLAALSRAQRLGYACEMKAQILGDHARAGEPGIQAARRALFATGLRYNRDARELVRWLERARP